MAYFNCHIQKETVKETTDAKISCNFQPMERYPNRVQHFNSYIMDKKPSSCAFSFLVRHP